MNTRNNYVRIMCEIGIFAAIGFVLDELQGIISKGLFINGGSIGFAMLAVIVIGYRRGWLPALLTGLIMGALDISTSAYIIHPAQLFLDYLLPYGLVAIGCLFQIPFKKSKEKSLRILWLGLGVLVGGLFKFLSHYLAGVLFWADPNNFAWGLTALNPYLYCFIYNIAFMGPSIILVTALAITLLLRVPSVFLSEQIVTEKPDADKMTFPLVLNSVVVVGTTFTFVWFLIGYIKSFYSYQGEGYFGYDFNPDCMLIAIISSFIIVLCVFSYIRIFLHKFSLVFYSTILLFHTSMSLVYCIARLIRMYVKDKDPTLYWIWFGIGLFTVLLNISLLVFANIRRKKALSEASQSA